MRIISKDGVVGDEISEMKIGVPGYWEGGPDP